MTYSTLAENPHELMSPLSAKDALAAQKLEDENRELMVFFNAMGEVFFSVDMVARKVIQISPACEKLYGYKQADFLANEQFWYGLMHPEDRHIIENEDIILRSGGQVNNQYRIIRKDKTIRWVENKIIPTLDENGRLIRVDGITRDITARKEAIIQRRRDEEAIKKSEANLRTIFDNTDSAYILFNSELNIVSFNSLAQKYSEERNNVSLEINRSIKDYFLPQRWPFIKETLDKLVSTGEPITYELALTSTDGSERWHEVRWLNVKNNDNKNWGFILANKDITEVKLAALEREKITADLIQHNKDLEQFTYIISHNLRAPVANIIGLSEMLKEHELDAEIQKEVIERVSTSIKGIDMIIKDLNHILTTRNLVNEKKEDVYFTDLVDAIRTGIYAIRAKENVQINCHFDEVDSLFTIRSYIYSIFYNLLSNSIKYSQPGIDPLINITSHKLEDKVELRFKDNGKGIDLHKNGPHLFGLYKRFDNTTEGKGMGLFMVKTQVEALGGTIAINSKLGEGTEFVIELPM